MSLEWMGRWYWWPMTVENALTADNEQSGERKKGGGFLASSCEEWKGGKGRMIGTTTRTVRLRSDCGRFVGSLASWLAWFNRRATNTAPRRDLLGCALPLLRLYCYSY